MLNRTIAPEFKIPEAVNLAQAELIQLDNGIPVYMVNAGHQEVIRVEIIFEAGAWYENITGEAYFAAKMLREGTKVRSAEEIEEFIAVHGAFLDINSGPDRSCIELYTLNKHLPKLLPILHEIIANPSFNEKDLAKLLNITLQNLKVNLEKTAYIASRTFKASVFGSEHAYGRTLSEENISLITPEIIKNFFNENYKTGNCIIVVSGAIPNHLISILNSSLGTAKLEKRKVSKSTDDFSYTPSKKVIERKDSLQSSIRIGMPAINLNHPDYFKLNLTLEIFGGYFGSRLMKNIREDKGYTYGIYASHIAMQNASFMVISTDVNKENTSQTIEEIVKEIKILQQEPVQEEELTTVKNYLVGSFLNSINTPFAIADKFKMVYYHNLGYSFYDQHLSSMKSITAEEILETAQQYLIPENMTEIVVGGK